MRQNEVIRRLHAMLDNVDGNLNAMRVLRESGETTIAVLVPNSRGGYDPVRFAPVGIACVALASGLHPDTVRSYLRGEILPVDASVRIIEALRGMGIVS